MHLKWLEDIIAVARAPSLTEAANARRVTQPAFSRRLRALEDWLGTDLIDRSRKAAALTPVAYEHLEQIEALASQFHRLRDDIALWRRRHGSLVLVAQHSLATTVLPELVVRLRSNEAIAELRVQAADLDDCNALLAEGGADILIAYEATNETSFHDKAFDRLPISRDIFIPVASCDMARDISNKVKGRRLIDIVCYPKNVFFGSILHRRILPALKAGDSVRVRCETALASGIMELVLAGIGVGWVPRFLAKDNLEQGRLVDLSDELGSVSLNVVAMRLNSNVVGVPAHAWGELSRLAEAGSTPPTPEA